MNNGEITKTVQAERRNLRWETFKLPDGQYIDVMIRLNGPGESQSPRWEVTLWLIEDPIMEPHGQKMACFEVPLDTFAYGG